MTIEINLPADLKAAVEKKARAAGLDVNTYVLNLVRVAAVPEELGAKLRGEALEKELSHLTKGLPALGDEVDGSRESIYSGRGE